MEREPAARATPLRVNPRPIPPAPYPQGSGLEGVGGHEMSTTTPEIELVRSAVAVAVDHGILPEGTSADVGRGGRGFCLRAPGRRGLSARLDGDVVIVIDPWDLGREVCRVSGGWSFRA